MKAAVLHKTEAPLPQLAIENVDIDTPMSHEVLVRTAATGVCHSDLHYLQGTSVMPMPSVLGHEGAGVDYSYEAIGLKQTVMQCFTCIAVEGTATVIGLMPLVEMLELDRRMFFRGKLQGSMMARTASGSTCRAPSTPTRKGGCAWTR